jgi:hypothetical protein
VQQLSCAEHLGLAAESRHSSVSKYFCQSFVRLLDAIGVIGNNTKADDRYKL